MKPQREHATNNAQTYMVTSSTWERRALFQAEPWAKLLIDTLYRYRGSAYLLHEFEPDAARLEGVPFQNKIGSQRETSEQSAEASRTQAKSKSA